MLNVMRGVVGLPISPNQSAIDPELAEYFDSTGYDQNGQIKSCNIEKNNNGSENMYDWGNDGSKFNYFYHHISHKFVLWKQILSLYPFFGSNTMITEIQGVKLRTKVCHNIKLNSKSKTTESFSI